MMFKRLKQKSDYSPGFQQSFFVSDVFIGDGSAGGTISEPGLYKEFYLLKHTSFWEKKTLGWEGAKTF